MEKLYTQKEYQLQAEQANKDGLFLYQLVKEQEYTIEVLEYEKKTVLQDVYSEDGKIIGSQEVEINDLTKPIMVKEEITNPETGDKETITVQKHHTETRTKTVVELVIKPKGYYVCFKDNYTDGTIIEYFEEKELLKEKNKKYEENQKALDKARTSHVFMVTLQNQECEFDTTDKTQADLNSAAISASMGQPWLWTTNNRITLSLTAEDIQVISTAYMQAVNADIAKWTAFEEQIEQAQTVDAVNNINLDYTL